jgi:hypothetical protein
MIRERRTDNEDNECNKKIINRKHVRTIDTSSGSKAPGNEQKHAVNIRHQKKVKASNNKRLNLLADLALTSSTTTSTNRKSAAAPEALLQNEQKPPANGGKQVSCKERKITPKKLTRKCLKEECGRILTGKQRKRCEEHHMRCMRKDCANFVQEHNTGLCYKHAGGATSIKCRTVASTKKGRVCLKEGCGIPLTGQQRKRCKEHHWQCAKEGCIKNEQSHHGGFCKVHFSSNLG